MIFSKQKLHISFRVGMLLVSMITLLATSLEKTRLSSGEMKVKSDCVGAQCEGVLTISTSFRSDEYYAENATEYGFPSDNFTVTSDDSTNIARYESTNESSVCSGVLVSSDVDFMLFSCETNGEITCTITLYR